jgi:hypothetical protein
LQKAGEMERVIERVGDVIYGGGLAKDEVKGEK